MNKVVRPGGSDTHAYAIKFGVALRRAMQNAGVKRGAMAKACGVSTTMIDLYRMGRNLPSGDKAATMAEVLRAPELERMVRSMRFGQCAVCSTAFRRNNSRRRYCTEGCRKLAAKGVTHRAPLDPRQAAIDAMCIACEPEGECRDAVCPLRAFSPLPIYQRRVA